MDPKNDARDDGFTDMLFKIEERMNDRLTSWWKIGGAQFSSFAVGTCIVAFLLISALAGWVPTSGAIGTMVLGGLLIGAVLIASGLAFAFANTILGRVDAREEKRALVDMTKSIAAAYITAKGQTVEARNVEDVIRTVAAQLTPKSAPLPDKDG